jgi:hypothetical protein
LQIANSEYYSEFRNSVTAEKMKKKKKKKKKELRTTKSAGKI